MYTRYEQHEKKNQRRAFCLVRMEGCGNEHRRLKARRQRRTTRVDGARARQPIQQKIKNEREANTLKMQQRRATSGIGQPPKSTYKVAETGAGEMCASAWYVYAIRSTPCSLRRRPTGPAENRDTRTAGKANIRQRGKTLQNGAGLARGGGTRSGGIKGVVPGGCTGRRRALGTPSASPHLPARP